MGSGASRPWTPQAPGDWQAVKRHFRDGHEETQWTLEAAGGPYGPDQAERAVVVTTDPAPLDFLLSERYAAERRARVSPHRAMEPPSYGMPPDSSDTIYLSVVDGEGNACSFINSLYMGRGSGIVARKTPVFLQNRGAGFSLEAGHPTTGGR